MKRFNFTTDFYFTRNHDGRKVASERVGMKRVDLLAVGIYDSKGREQFGATFSLHKDLWQ